MVLLYILEYASYRLIQQAAEGKDTRNYHQIVCGCREALQSASVPIPEPTLSLKWFSVATHQLVLLCEYTEQAIVEGPEETRNENWRERAEYLQNIVESLDEVECDPDSDVGRDLQKAIDDVRTLAALNYLNTATTRHTMQDVLPTLFPAGGSGGHNQFFRERLLAIDEWGGFRNFAQNNGDTKGLDKNATQFLTRFYPYKTKFLPRTTKLLWRVCQGLFDEPWLLRHEKGELNEKEQEREQNTGNVNESQLVLASQNAQETHEEGGRKRRKTGEEETNTQTQRESPEEILRKATEAIQHINITASLLRRVYLEEFGASEEQWESLLHNRDDTLTEFAQQNQQPNDRQQPPPAQAPPRVPPTSVRGSTDEVIAQMIGSVHELIQKHRDPMLDIHQRLAAQNANGESDGVAPSNQIRGVHGIFDTHGPDDGEQVQFTDSEDDDRPRMRFPDTGTSKEIPPLDTRRLNLGLRRTNRYWKPHEVAHLREGVNRFGPGSWKKILETYDFDGRTPVDLKDKWANMTKYGQA
eukprot:comp17400_c1_seq1/m.16738 comp17400_c1_seq1/g.16738  ORF comp17400_c1_seq1/g.16738 comp17400_c1_seq1/m.16738 type:complete len:526 (-) comp17400_c1_seq1:437-2014(-)